MNPTATNIRTRRIHIACVSHGCELWDGPKLAAADIRALQVVHALIHTRRAVTVKDIVGER